MVRNSPLKRVVYGSNFTHHTVFLFYHERLQSNKKLVNKKVEGILWYGDLLIKCGKGIKSNTLM